MQKLLFLHGALGTSLQFQPLNAALEEDFDIRVIDFFGHGSRASEEMPTFGIEQFGRDVLAWMDKEEIQQTNIFGYSMGGYVALWLAANYPNRVGKVITLATKFAWNPEAAEKETALLNPEKIKEKVPVFAGQLAQLHGEDSWQKVMQNTAKMMLALGMQPVLSESDMSTIQTPVQVMVGDRDSMVSLEETVAAFRQLPNAKLSVLPDTRHPLERVSVGRLAFEIRHFLS